MRRRIAGSLATVLVILVAFPLAGCAAQVAIEPYTRELPADQYTGSALVDGFEIEGDIVFSVREDGRIFIGMFNIFDPKTMDPLPARQRDPVDQMFQDMAQYNQVLLYQDSPIGVRTAAIKDSLLSYTEYIVRAEVDSLRPNLIEIELANGERIAHYVGSVLAEDVAITSEKLRMLTEREIDKWIAFLQAGRQIVVENGIFSSPRREDY